MSNDNSPKNVLEFQRRFAAGEFEKNDFDTQVSAGWFDWFCETEELGPKTQWIGELVSRIEPCNGKVDLESEHVFFMNCCPVSYPLYDSIRFNNGCGNTYIIDVDCAYDTGKKYQVRYVPIYGLGMSNRRVQWMYLDNYAKTRNEIPAIAAFDELDDLIAWFNDGRDAVECIIQDGFPEEE